MSKQKSVMTHQFSQVPKAEIQRSSFDRSHGYKTTFDAGYLVPILVDEALPGDTYNVNMTGFARLATPIFPLMDNMFMETFFFAVPNRLVWDNWQKFNGEQETPGDSTDFLIPTTTAPAGGFDIGTLSDYFGIPTEINNITVSSLWHRAYNLVYNEWFRDQNMVDPAEERTDDGPDGSSIFPLQRRGKRHDYFTSALPFPQKGEAVGLPLGITAPVVAGQSPGGPSWFVDGAEQTLGSTNSEQYAVWSDGTAATISEAFWFNPNLEADLSAASSFTIAALRLGFQVQRMLERDARGGTRYTEIIKAHFGVTSPDARLQRPEYLGGGSSPINVVPVPQTSSTQDSQGPVDTPQGNLAAYGTSVMRGHGFTKSFTEHCLIIGLINVRADLTYQQGINRMFSRQTRFDFYWPALAHLGEQTILNKEIYATNDEDQQDEIFGYQERYAEMRYKPSVITGLFRSEADGSLDAWHLSQHFSTPPVLNESFINEHPPIGRVIAVQDEPHFLLDLHFNMQCARPMPTYGVPGMIDHF